MCTILISNLPPLTIVVAATEEIAVAIKTSEFWKCMVVDLCIAWYEVRDLIVRCFVEL